MVANNFFFSPIFLPLFFYGLLDVYHARQSLLLLLEYTSPVSFKQLFDKQSAYRFWRYLSNVSLTSASLKSEEPPLPHMEEKY